MQREIKSYEIKRKEQGRKIIINKSEEKYKGRTVLNNNTNKINKKSYKNKNKINKKSYKNKK